MTMIDGALTPGQCVANFLSTHSPVDEILFPAELQHAAN